MRKSTRKTNVKSSNGNKKLHQSRSLGRFDLVEQASEIEHLLQRAVRHELSIHRRLGNSVAVWRDGKVVIIPPEEILISTER